MANDYHIVKNPTVQLSSGHHIPLVGLGTWMAKKGEVGKAVEVALRAGYRHFDCSPVYQNEDEIGAALDSAFGEGAVKRSDVFITTKLWNAYHASGQVRDQCVSSLQALKLTYLDLYLIHWPVTGNNGPHLEPSLLETWAAMERLVDEGLVRSIGVSNFSTAKLRLVLEHAKIPPAVNQVEMHPYLRQDGLVAFCKEHNIHITAYSPLGSPEAADIPMLRRSAELPAVLKDPVVHRIADKLGKNAGQVLIRWAVQRGTSVIPKSTNPERIKSNLDVVDWELPADDFKALSSFEEHIRYYSGIFWCHPEGPYRTVADLWDDPKEDVHYEDIVKKYGEAPVPAS